MPSNKPPDSNFNRVPFRPNAFEFVKKIAMPIEAGGSPSDIYRYATNLSWWLPLHQDPQDIMGPINDELNRIYLSVLEYTKLDDLLWDRRRGGPKSNVKTDEVIRALPRKLKIELVRAIRNIYPERLVCVRTCKLNLVARYLIDALEET